MDARCLVHVELENALVGTRRLPRRGREPVLVLQGILDVSSLADFF